MTDVDISITTFIMLTIKDEGLKNAYEQAIDRDIRRGDGRCKSCDEPFNDPSTMKLKDGVERQTRTFVICRRTPACEQFIDTSRKNRLSPGWQQRTQVSIVHTAIEKSGLRFIAEVPYIARNGHKGDIANKLGIPTSWISYIDGHRIWIEET